MKSKKWFCNCLWSNVLESYSSDRLNIECGGMFGGRSLALNVKNSLKFYFLAIFNSK